jgi:hypothetical protein
MRQALESTECPGQESTKEVVELITKLEQCKSVDFTYRNAKAQALVGLKRETHRATLRTGDHAL